MSQAVAAELVAQQQPGSIVSISSISGMNTAPFHIAYGTAKAAIVGDDPHDGGRTGAGRTSG